jgi:cytochrome P450
MNQLSLFSLLRIVFYIIGSALTKPGFRAYQPNKYKTFYKDPNPIYDQILEQQPVFFSPSMASWIVTRYEDVHEGIRDTRLDPNFFKWRFTPPCEHKTDWDKVISGLLFTLDKKNHHRIRRLTTPAFGPKTIDNIRCITNETVEQCLNAIEPGTVINFAEVVAQVIPREIVSRLVGVKQQDQYRFEALTSSLYSLADPAAKVDPKHAQQGIDMMREYIEERKKAPSDDFLSLLLTHVEDGDRISEWEAIGLIASLIAAGPDTSSDDLNFAIYNLLQNPAVIDQLLADPQLIDDVITESTRWNHFGYSAPIRFALEDIEIGGHLIKQGEMVRFLLPAANRDPAVFEHPERFDLTRPNLNQVIRYGAGAHFCVGSAIAQTIATTTVLAFLQRFPHLRMVEEPVYEKHLTSRRMTRFMLQL